MKVLVIDSDWWIVDVLQQVLKYENYETFSAGTGAQGLALARQHRPDLVISNVVMPDLSGQDILATLQADPVTAPVPILFLSDFGHEMVVRQIMTQRNVSFIRKPFTLPEVLVAVKLCVRQL